MALIAQSVTGKSSLQIGDCITKNMERFAPSYPQFFPASTVLNASIAGDTVEAILYRVELMDIPSSVSHISLLCGTNDLFSDSPATISSTITEMFPLRFSSQILTGPSYQPHHNPPFLPPCRYSKQSPTPPCTSNSPKSGPHPVSVPGRTKPTPKCSSRPSGTQLSSKASPGQPRSRTSPKPKPSSSKHKLSPTQPNQNPYPDQTRSNPSHTQPRKNQALPSLLFLVKTLKFR